MILAIILCVVILLFVLLKSKRNKKQNNNANYDEINCDDMSQFTDSCLPELTNGSFFVKINYANLSDAEIKAFTSEFIHISYFKAESNSPIIFMVFDFNGAMVFEIAINLKKLLIPLETWVNTNEETVTLYLFERTTGSISGVRTIKLRYLEAIKEELFRQERYTVKQIDDEIYSIRNKFSISDMIRFASADELIHT